MSLLSWLWSGGRRADPNAGAGSAHSTSTVVGVGRAIGTIVTVGTASATSTATAVGSTALIRRSGTGITAGTSTAVAVSAAITIGDGQLAGIRLEVALPAAAFQTNAFQTNAFGGTAWTDLMSDTRTTDPIVLDYGVTGNGPEDRVGSTGTLTFTLNNATDNSLVTPSLYSPLHASRRPGFDLNVPVRLVFDTLDGQTYYKFLGRLAEINPEPGRHGTYRVPCTAVDLMDDWAATTIPVVLPVTANLDAGSLIDYLFAVIRPVAPDLLPASRSLETGVDILPFAFHDPGRRKIRELLIDAVMSEFGFASMCGTVDPRGGLFLFQNRHAATLDGVQASLINQFAVDTGFQATQSRDALASSIEVFVAPTDTDPTDVDLFTVVGAPLLIFPFQTLTLHLPFKSPARPDTPIAALHLIPPEPHVDYTMNAAVDGSSTDLTDNFLVEHVYPEGGFEAVISITNRGTPALVPGPPSNIQPGFVTLLKGRGRGLYISEASALVTLDSVYGRRPLTITMPWQANVNTATDIAHFFGNLYRQPFAQIDGVRFCANKTATLMQMAVFLEPGHLVYIQEDITGIAGTFRIQGVHLEIMSGILWCTWRLQAVDRQQFWQLGVLDHSELGLTTVLGF